MPWGVARPPLIVLSLSICLFVFFHQATKDGEQLLRLARATVDLLEREAREGTSRKHKLNQQAASTAEVRNVKRGREQGG